MNNNLNLTTVSLSNRSRYNTNYYIQGVSVTMRCGYNPRNKLRWVILLDMEGKILLPQTFIKKGKRCELGFLSNQYNLNYYITLKEKDKYKVFSENYDYLNWANDFDICFVGYPYKLVEDGEILTRRYLTGN